MSTTTAYESRHSSRDDEPHKVDAKADAKATQDQAKKPRTLPKSSQRRNAWWLPRPAIRSCLRCATRLAC